MRAVELTKLKNKVSEDLFQKSWLQQRIFGKASKRLKVVESANSESKVSGKLPQKSYLQDVSFEKSSKRGPAKSENKVSKQLLQKSWLEEKNWYVFQLVEDSKASKFRKCSGRTSGGRITSRKLFKKKFLQTRQTNF